MPRGQYDRSAARSRREGTAYDDANIMSGDAAPIKASTSRIDRGEEWGNRSRKVKGAIDYYNLAHGLAPSDAIYQWKSYSIYGQEQKVKQIVYQENGWSAVPATRHPQLPSMDSLIIHEGLILMEQPKHLYQEARREEEKAHKEQLRSGYESIAKTPSGQMDRQVNNLSSKNEAMYVDAPEYQREAE